MLELLSVPLTLLAQYGYPFLFLWSVLEGEIGLMLAGLLASEGRHFTYEGIVAVAIVGAVIGDNLLFWIGWLFRKRARRWLDAHPRKRDTAMHLLRRWGSWLIVFERFIYGTHIPALLSVGMSGYAYMKFLLYDLLGVVLWAFTFVSVGYFFGQRAIDLIVMLQKNIPLMLLLLGVILSLLLTSNRTDGDD